MTDTHRKPEYAADKFDPAESAYVVTWDRYVDLLDERDRCKARAERAEEALEEVVAEYDGDNNGRYLRWAVDSARAALKDKETTNDEST